MTKSSDIWVLSMEKYYISHIDFFSIFTFVTSFLLLKCNRSPHLVPMLGTLSVNLPSASDSRSFLCEPPATPQGQDTHGRGFVNRHATETCIQIQASHVPGQRAPSMPLAPPGVWMPSAPAAGAVTGWQSPGRSPTLKKLTRQEPTY